MLYCVWFVFIFVPRTKREPLTRTERLWYGWIIQSLYKTSKRLTQSYGLLHLGTNLYSIHLLQTKVLYLLADLVTIRMSRKPICFGDNRMRNKWTQILLLMYQGDSYLKIFTIDLITEWRRDRVTIVMQFEYSITLGVQV